MHKSEKILGVGTDLVHIPRIEKLINTYGSRFIHRLFTEQEQHYAKGITSPRQMACFYAKRFAGKEAIVKALGTGFNGHLLFQEIEILKDDAGKPYVSLGPTIQQYLKDQAPFKDSPSFHHRLDLSLSDDYPLALAFAIWVQIL